MEHALILLISGPLQIGACMRIRGHHPLNPPRKLGCFRGPNPRGARPGDASERNPMSSIPAAKQLHQHLSAQVLSAVAAGVVLGAVFPASAEKMQPLGDAFIRLIRMLIAPIIFCTVVHGIASMNDLRRAGRVAFKALIHFEVISTLALVIGLAVVNIWKPGAGMNVDTATLDASQIWTSRR
jgi:hypothetical protein